MSLKVLFLGEIVGRAGLTAVKKFLPPFRQEEKIDLVVANAEGTTGGFGLGKNHALYLRKLGVDVVTVGEKGFFKKDLTELMGKSAFLLRPANFPPEVPGRGYRLTEINGQKIAVISLLGQNGFTRMHLNNPFHTMNYLLEKLKDNDTILVEFHAATTAEKQAMACFLDGKAAVVAGTHSKALTADAEVLAGGTGRITDTGRCGSLQSVGGFLPKTEIDKFLTGIPARSRETAAGTEIQGALFEIDGNRCLSAEIIRKPVTVAEAESSDREADEC